MEPGLQDEARAWLAAQELMQLRRPANFNGGFNFASWSESSPEAHAKWLPAWFNGRLLQLAWFEEGVVLVNLPLLSSKLDDPLRDLLNREFRANMGEELNADRYVGYFNISEELKENAARTAQFLQWDMSAYSPRPYEEQSWRLKAIVTQLIHAGNIIPCTLCQGGFLTMGSGPSSFKVFLECVSGPDIAGNACSNCQWWQKRDRCTHGTNPVPLLSTSI